MDLKTFVAESLKQIAEGIKEAQEADTGALVCPRITDAKTMHVAVGANAYIAQSVSFDVAVTASQSGSGSAFIKVAWLEVGAGADSGVANASISRIRFDIPMVWPKPKAES